MASALSLPALRNAGDNDMSLTLPLVPDRTRVMYALRSGSDRIGGAVSAGESAPTTREPIRMAPGSITFGRLSANYFGHDQTMAVVFLCSGPPVTATGVYQLASFWVRGHYR